MCIIIINKYIYTSNTYVYTPYVNMCDIYIYMLKDYISCFEMTSHDPNNLHIIMSFYVL